VANLGMLKEKIEQDINEAMKAKDEITLAVLRMLKAAITNEEIAVRTKEGKTRELKEEEIQMLVEREIKKRKEAVELYEKGGRPDKAQQEFAEAEILKKYLPEQLPEEEVREIIKRAIAEVGAQGLQDMGRVMGEVMGKIKGRAPGEMVSKIVKEELESKVKY
jgi:uncharacterized protein YqeY